jgi:hypothetical protein
MGPVRRLVIVLAVTLVPAAGAATPTVVGSGTIGAYRFEQPRSRALHVFGAPTYSRDSHGINAPAFDTPRCRTTWRSLELTIEYEGPCTTPGRARRAEIEGVGWRTRERLRVGDSVARLKRLYRGARLTPIPSGATVERWGVYPRGREWDLRRARPSSNVIVVTQGNVVTGFELRPASLR